MTQKSQPRALPAGGSKVRMRFGSADVEATVLEHRGPVGVGGEQLLQMRFQYEDANERIVTEVAVGEVTPIDTAALGSVVEGSRGWDVRGSLEPGASYDFSDDLEPRPLEGHSCPQARVIVGDYRQTLIVYMGWSGEVAYREEPEVGVRPMAEQLVLGEVGAYETAGKGREERADRVENGLQFGSLQRARTVASAGWTKRVRRRARGPSRRRRSQPPTPDGSVPSEAAPTSPATGARSVDDPPAAQQVFRSPMPDVRVEARGGGDELDVVLTEARAREVSLSAL